MVSIQNEFNLLHSKDWPYLVEQCVHEDIAFLPWSPIGGGILSGKYLKGARPDNEHQRQEKQGDEPRSEHCETAEQPPSCLGESCYKGLRLDGFGNRFRRRHLTRLRKWFVKNQPFLLS